MHKNEPRKVFRYDSVQRYEIGYGDYRKIVMVNNS